MKSNVRTIIIASLTTIFVMALAFAPKFIADTPQSTVRFEQTSEEFETTTTTIPETTTTTAPTTTTTEIIDALVIEAPTTTTTVAAPAPPTAQFMGSTPIESGFRLKFWAFNPEAGSFPNATIRFSVDGVEFTLPITMHDASVETDITGEANNISIVRTEWDGGYLPTGIGYATDVVTP